MPVTLIVLGLLIVIYSTDTNRAVFGRHVYAIGGNRHAAELSGIKTAKVDFLLFVNMSATGVEFHLPEGDGGRPWKRIVDTAEWAEPENNFFDPATSDPFTAGERYWVHPFSITVFQGPPA